MADLSVQHLDMTFTNPQTGAAVQALKDVSFTLKRGSCCLSLARRAVARPRC